MCVCTHTHIYLAESLCCVAEINVINQLCFNKINFVQSEHNSSFLFQQRHKESVASELNDANLGE